MKPPIASWARIRYAAISPAAPSSSCRPEHRRKPARPAPGWPLPAPTYVDASIKCYPDKVGAPESLIFAGGAPEAYARAEPFLRAAGGDLRYLGDNVAAAAALDLGALAVSVALYAGVAHGARICTSEGVGADLLAAMIPFGKAPRDRAEIIHAGAYELASLHPGASLAVWSDVVDLIQQAGKGLRHQPRTPRPPRHDLPPRPRRRSWRRGRGGAVQGSGRRVARMKRSEIRGFVSGVSGSRVALCSTRATR